MEKTCFWVLRACDLGGGEGYILVCVRMMASGTYHEGILHTQVRCPDQSEIRVKFRILNVVRGLAAELIKDQIKYTSYSKASLTDYMNFYFYFW